jgi:hypothetical protein
LYIGLRPFHHLPPFFLPPSTLSLLHSTILRSRHTSFFSPTHNPNPNPTHWLRLCSRLIKVYQAPFTHLRSHSHSSHLTSNWLHKHTPQVSPIISQFQCRKSPKCSHLLVLMIKYLRSLTFLVHRIIGTGFPLPRHCSVTVSPLVIVTWPLFDSLRTLGGTVWGKEESLIEFCFLIRQNTHSL